MFSIDTEFRSAVICAGNWRKPFDEQLELVPVTAHGILGTIYHTVSEPSIRRKYEVDDFSVRSDFYSVQYHYPFAISPADVSIAATIWTKEYVSTALHGPPCRFAVGRLR